MHKYQPFSAYQRYLAIKQHFTHKNYDAIRYNFKVKTSRQAFEKRNDKLFFHKLANQNDLDGFLVSLFIRNPELWVGDMVLGYQRAEEIYKDWRRRQDSLSYLFTEDMKKLVLRSDLKCLQGQHPRALRLMLQEEISVESLAVLCSLTKALERWEKKLAGDIVYEQYALILNKYLSFLIFDRQKFSMILKSEMERQNGL